MKRQIIATSIFLITVSGVAYATQYYDELSIQKENILIDNKQTLTMEREIAFADIEDYLQLKDSEINKKPLLTEVTSNQDYQVNVKTNYPINVNDYNVHLIDNKGEIIHNIEMVKQEGTQLSFHTYRHLFNQTLYNIVFIHKESGYEIDSSFTAHNETDYWVDNYQIISSNLIKVKLNKPLEKMGILYPNEFDGYILKGSGDTFYINVDEELKQNILYDFNIKYYNNQYSEDEIYGYFQYIDKQRETIQITDYQYISPYDMTLTFNYHLLSSFDVQKMNMYIGDTPVSIKEVTVMEQNKLYIKLDKPIENGNYRIHINEIRDSLYALHKNVKYDFSMNELKEYPLFNELSNVKFINQHTIRFTYPTGVDVSLLKDIGNYQLESITTSSVIRLDNIKVNEKAKTVDIEADVKDINQPYLFKVNFLLPHKNWYGYSIQNNSHIVKNRIEKITLKYNQNTNSYYIQLSGLLSSTIKAEDIVLKADGKNIALKAQSQDGMIHYALNKDLFGKTIQFSTKNDSIQFEMNKLTLPSLDVLTLSSYTNEDILILEANDYFSLTEEQMILTHNDEKVSYTLLNKNEKNNIYYIKLNQDIPLQEVSIQLNNIQGLIDNQEEIVITSHKPYENKDKIIQSYKKLNNNQFVFSIHSDYLVNKDFISDIGIIGNEKNNIYSIIDSEVKDNQLVVKVKEDISESITISLPKNLFNHQYMLSTKSNAYSLKMNINDYRNAITPYINPEIFNSKDKNDILYNDSTIYGENKSVKPNAFLLLQSTDNKIISTTNSNENGAFSLAIPINYQHMKEFKLISISKEGIVSSIEIIKP